MSISKSCLNFSHFFFIDNMLITKKQLELFKSFDLSIKNIFPEEYIQLNRHHLVCFPKLRLKKYFNMVFSVLNSSIMITWIFRRVCWSCSRDKFSDSAFLQIDSVKTASSGVIDSGPENDFVACSAYNEPVVNGSGWFTFDTNEFDFMLNSKYIFMFKAKSLRRTFYHCWELVLVL